MHFAEFWQGLGSCFLRRRRSQKPRRTLFCEYLEQRTVPTVIWGSAGSRTVLDSGGAVITHADVDLIFWGDGWNNSSSQTLMNNVISSVNTIMNSPYLSGLSQYRGIGNGQVVRTDVITTSSPSASFTNTQIQNMVSANIKNGVLPPPSSDSQLIYMVITQPGSSAGNIGGEHGSVGLSGTRYRYGWTINNGRLDTITNIYSHELTETVTDPEPGFGFWVPSTSDEICDGAAQNYSYRLNGVLVQSSLSQADQAYDVYDGNAQKLILTSSRALTVNGDQLDSADDTITIDMHNNGYVINVNGEVFQFDPGQVSSITINTLTGNDTVNIERTISGVPVTINLGSGSATVNLSPTAQNLGNLAGTVAINGGSEADTLNLFDRGINTNRNYAITSTTVAGSGMATVTYHNLSSIVLNASNGTDSITLQSTPAGTALAVNGGSGTDTLVGSAVDNTWRITGSNTGTLVSARIAGLVSFTAVQNLTGGAANNTFVFSDGAGMSGNIQGEGGGVLDYSAYTSDVSVSLQTATATGVGGTITGIQSLKGGGGNNTLVGADVSEVWNLTGTNVGNVAGTVTVAFTGFQNLTGGAAANAFVFSDRAGISGNLDGGSGGSLDYSAYTSSVIVDLQTATATGVGGSIAHVQNVTGGAGGGAGVYNILVGNGGNTLIAGNGRRNLLIAGSSASTLSGGDDDDILIGGTTAYDMNVASLTAIMDYWSATSDDYATRVGNVLAGNGVPLLDPTTVTSNGGGNTLTGGLGLNLYYGNDTDNTDFDPNSGSVFIPV